ncbi:MAG: SGNH/GDSL hydrolase family protein [Kiritimatiellae bacterium]|jgi:lysophospholipase L1-like esterase|nr:SGNH/GDSL hydrolase family protein [Kiritimatiellia bacterium]
MKLQTNQTLAFIGDSITDCGRTRPVGNGKTGLGEGYVAFVDGWVQACYPERGIRVLNTGIGGNRITDLEARWQSDVLDLQPDWLSIMIGINDVWRQFDNVFDADQVLIDRFERVYRSLLSTTRPGLKGLVLMTPFFIEPNPSDPMRETMDRYGEVVKNLAAEFDALLVDVQAAFDGYLKHQPSQSLCGDRVHPNKAGHMIIARAFLNAVEFAW